MSARGALGAATAGMLIASSIAGAQPRPDPDRLTEPMATPPRTASNTSHVPSWPAIVGAGLATASLAGAVVFARAAVREQDRAKDYYESDPRLREIQDDFRRDRIGWISCLGFAALSAGFTTYWVVHSTSGEPRLDVASPDGESIVVRWTGIFQ